MEANEASKDEMKARPCTIPWAREERVLAPSYRITAACRVQTALLSIRYAGRADVAPMAVCLESSREDHRSSLMGEAAGPRSSIAGHLADRGSL